MRNSAQMREEMNFIKAQVNAFYTEAFSNYPYSFDRVNNLHHEDLTTYKVRIEELICETDIKEQSKTIFGAFKSSFLF